MFERTEPLPAIEVEPEEDRLDEKGETFSRERKAEDAARERHEARPEESELEGQNRAGDCADGEEDSKRLRPPAGKHHPGFIVSPQGEALSHRHEQWHPNAEDGENDMEPQRGPHRRPCEG